MMIKKYRNTVIKDSKASSESGSHPLDNGDPYEISEQRFCSEMHFRLMQICKGELDEVEIRGRETCAVMR